jgi:septal ring factor EnvC (AmiA/AmiB activator)
MSTTKSLMLAIFLASVSLCGCDKAELEATKQQLQTVSSERDALKAQVEASKQQVAQLQQQNNELQGKVTTAMAALTAMAADPKAEGAKGDKKQEAAKGDKKGAGAAKAAPAKPSEPAKTP